MNKEEAKKLCSIIKNECESISFEQVLEIYEALTKESDDKDMLKKSISTTSVDTEKRISTLETRMDYVERRLDCMIPPTVQPITIGDIPQTIKTPFPYTPQIVYDVRTNRPPFNDMDYSVSTTLGQTHQKAE